MGLSAMLSPTLAMTLVGWSFSAVAIAETSTMQVACALPAFAVMVALPLPAARSLPLRST